MMAFGACSTAGPTAAPTGAPATVPATASSAPSSEVHPGPTPVTQPLAASDAGLDVAVRLSSTMVTPGGTVRVDVVITNNRSAPAIIAREFCDGMALVSGTLPLPREPIGQTWDGIAAAYKAYALSHEHGNDTDFAYLTGLPDRPGVTPFFCPPSLESGSVILQPGHAIEASVNLTAELTPGVPAVPGDLPFTVLVLHDPGPTPTGPCPCERPAFKRLTVSGVISVVGTGPHLLSQGEVVDALLTDDRFSSWLATQPASTWSTASLFLQNIGEGQGIVPSGPAWELDLFRETGVPRNWAIGFVDPFSGKVLNLAFCNVPCAR